MVYNIIVKEGALQDASDAFVYYETIQDGLGERFLKELAIRYKQLEKNPQHYSFLSTDREKMLRSVRLKNFPYLIIYDYTAYTVTVYAVHNSNKNIITLGV